MIIEKANPFLIVTAVIHHYAIKFTSPKLLDTCSLILKQAGHLNKKKAGPRIPELWNLVGLQPREHLIEGMLLSFSDLSIFVLANNSKTCNSLATRQNTSTSKHTVGYAWICLDLVFDVIRL
jgi:hypothetical protein